MKATILKVALILAIVGSAVGVNAEPKVETAGDGSVRLYDYRAEKLDLSHYRYMSFSVENPFDQRVIVDVSYFGPQKNHVNQGRFFVDPQSEQQVNLVLNRVIPADSRWRDAFPTIRGLPYGFVQHWNGFDLKTIKRVEVTLSCDDLNADMSQVVVSSPFGYLDFEFVDESYDIVPRPILDEMGQSRCGDWQGRLTSTEQLASLGAADVAKYGKQRELNHYGGWVDGPRFEARGRFYTTKYNGKWAFVTPDGYLYWSHGITGVGKASATSRAGREEFFPALESDIETVAVKREMIDFYDANLYRKYGKRSWEATHRSVSISRLVDWGFTSMGAWSDTYVGMKYPYTLIVHPPTKPLGRIKKMVDPFSDEFSRALNGQLKTWLGVHKGDPYNLGVFVSNELHWGNGDDIAEQVIAQPTSLAARAEMSRLFKKKYGNIAALNEAWGSSFDSFDKINSKGSQDFSAQYREDLHSYFCHFVESYFKQVRAAMDEHMPGHLYLGCRFHDNCNENEELQRIASKYVDVMSYNIYKYTPKDKEVCCEIDKPAIIGEFHFGTASHGVWGTGLRSAEDLENQAELYKCYVKDALQHPNFIGTHWFQWADQPATGRGTDGENFRIGFVNVTDQPYMPMVEAAKSIGAEMYKIRFE